MVREGGTTITASNDNMKSTHETTNDVAVNCDTTL